MAGTTILLNIKKGDEVVVYAYTGTWLADFAMNHYTHWVGLLLKVVFIFIANVQSIDKITYQLIRILENKAFLTFFSQVTKNATTF